MSNSCHHRHGAEVVDDSGPQRDPVFGGSGFKLGSDATTSEHIPGGKMMDLNINSI